MLIFYLDEFGDGCLKRSRQGNRWVLAANVSQWFVLGAVGIAETSRRDLAEDIIEIKDKYFPGWTTNPWKDTEIKGRFLSNAHARRSGGKPPSKAGYRHLTLVQVTKLCEDLSRLFMKFRPTVYVVAVDKARLAKHASPYKPEGVAYAFLQQRLALVVDEVYGDAEGALMVADEQQSHEKMFRSGEMLAIRTQVTTGLPRQPNFDLILDRPVWINPDLHRFDREILQLSDIVCYSVGAMLGAWAVPTTVACLWKEISACLATHWTTGRVPDGGISIYPRPDRYPAGL
jgi:hypothetical protein